MNHNSFNNNKKNNNNDNNNKSGQKPKKREPEKNNADHITKTKKKKPSKVGKVVGMIFFINYKILSYILNIALTILLIGILTGGIVVGAFALYIKNYIDPTIEDLTTMASESELTTYIYYYEYDDRINKINPKVVQMETLRGAQNRTWVKYKEFPDNLVNAFIALEDKRFREHHGVDWYRTVGVTKDFFLGSGGRVQGGSTITQQLIKNLTNDDEVRIQRKIQEILRAMYLESRTSKEEILETYMNIVNLSSGCYGVQAAAYTFFGKDVSDLNLIECAAIASIVQSPTAMNPIRRPENNKRRRDQCLENMLEQGLISQEDFDGAYNKELMINRPDNSYVETVKSYYVDQVINDVRDDLMKKYGYTDKIAEHMIYSGGYKIYTCMDKFIQTCMETVYADDKYFPAQPEGAIKFQSAMVVLDPYTGNLLGIVGGRGTDKVQRGLNRASMSKRQPGSSIKPVSVYAPALEKGVINWATPLQDIPVKKINNKWWPSNLPAGNVGRISLYDAIKVSKNTVAVQVLQMITPEYSYEFLSQKVGITSLIEAETTSSGKVLTDIDLAPLALGGLTYGVSVYELTAAYTMFLNEGIYSRPRSYIKVTDQKDNVILDNKQMRIPAISAENACIMTKLLMGVVEEGTAKGLNPEIKDNIQVAGKTGTAGTEKDDYDRWFIGYTPYFLCGAWFGYDTPKLLNVGTGAENPPLKLWAYVMNTIHKEMGLYANPMKFPSAPGLIEAKYCRDSGMAPTPNCSRDPENNRVSIGYFARGAEPMEPCIIHGLQEQTTEAQITEEITTEMKEETTAETTELPLLTTNIPVTTEKPTVPLITQPATQPTIAETIQEPETQPATVIPPVDFPPTQEITMEEFTIAQDEPDIQDNNIDLGENNNIDNNNDNINDFIAGE